MKRQKDNLFGRLFVLFFDNKNMDNSELYYLIQLCIYFFN